MTRRTGVQFQTGGIAERALRALADKPRGKFHHFDQALADMVAAQKRLPIRQAEFERMQRRRVIAAGNDIAAAERALQQATLNLDLAKRAFEVCVSKLKSKTDPRTGRPVSHSGGRAPPSASGPLELLEREERARGQLEAANAFIATSAMLPELNAPAARWARLQFAHFVQSPLYDELRWSALPNNGRDLTDPMLALVFLIYRHAAKNGLPLIVEVEDYFVIEVTHAIWTDRLNLADFMIIADFIDFAAKRLKIDCVWCGSNEPQKFRCFIKDPPPLDYGELVRRLRRHNWRSPAANDHDLFDGIEAPEISGPDPDPEIHSQPIADEPLPWVDPRPRLAHSSLPWSLIRLFRKIRDFDQVPPADLSKRSPGPAWYTVTGSHIVSPDLIAGELFEAISTGDLDCVAWSHDKIFPQIADDVVRLAIALTEEFLRERHG